MVFAHIIFTGIVAFWVVDSGPEAGKVWALAPMHDTMTNSHGVDQHIGWVKVPSCQVDDDDTTMEPESVENGFNIYRIEGFLELAGSCTKGPVTLWPESGKRTNGWIDDDHLVPLGRSHPKGVGHTVKLDRKIASETDYNRSRFKALLDGGELDVTFCNPNLEWKFRDSTDPPIRCMAQEVCNKLPLDCDGGRLTITIGREKLVVHPGGCYDHVFVMIGHTPTAEIFPDPDRHRHQEKDHHVKLYVDHSSRPHGNRLPLVKTDLSTSEDPVEFHDHPEAFHPRERAEEAAAARLFVAYGANCPPGWWEDAEYRP